MATSGGWSNPATWTGWRKRSQAITPQTADAARRQATAFRIEEAAPAWLAILEGATGATRLHVRQSRKEAVSGA